MSHPLAYRFECDRGTPGGVAKDDDELLGMLRAEGYPYVRKLDNGMVLGVCRYMYTWGLCVIECKRSMFKRYCYTAQIDALMAAGTWDGDGDPPGPWIVEKGAGEQRYGPGSRHQREKQA